MERTIDIENHPEQLNQWVRKSIDLFNGTAYLDNILEIYDYQVATPNRLGPDDRRLIQMAHSSRNTDELFRLLRNLSKFPYEDPIWFTINLMKEGFINNPLQRQRLAESLYLMTSEELLVRIESAPKLNTTTGQMFTRWLRNKFSSLTEDEFTASENGVFILDASEFEAKNYVNNFLESNVEKRPDLVMKVNKQYIIGEAKWIGSTGGNQDKSVREVLTFCSHQRGLIRRIGLVDGYIWATHGSSGTLLESQGSVLIQETTYDVMSALLLNDYLNTFRN